MLGLVLEIIRGERPAGRIPAVTAPRARAERTADRRRIAITAVGLRTPLGSRFDTFAPALLAGRSGVAPIRAFDARRFPVSVACEVPEIAVALPDVVAQSLRALDDRKSELAVAAAWDALAEAGELPPGTGVIYGTGLSSVSLTELRQDCLPFLDPAGRYDFPRFGRAAPPERPQAPWRHCVDLPLHLLRRDWPLGGPRATHFSACAAGAAAVGQALDLIRRGEAEAMLAGAADSMVHPFGMLPFILLGATSPGGISRPFDKDRDGFVMGEGAAFFFLEPLERARAAGRRVYGVLLGHGTSIDAYNVTAPHPTGEGAERAMRAALADAGLAPEAVDYVNAHGTGTALNDVTEALAIRRLFGPRPVPVSSSKAQLGHAIAAAGAVELLACLAAFAGGRLPPNPNLRHADPHVDLDLVPAEGRAGAPRVVLSNSFGFGGQNACLVIGHPEDF